MKLILKKNFFLYSNSFAFLKLVSELFYLDPLPNIYDHCANDQLLHLKTVYRSGGGQKFDFFRFFRVFWPIYIILS